MKSDRMVKTLLGIFTVAVIVFGPLSEGLAAETNPSNGGTGGNTVVWDYWSPLTVVENITDIGGGSYSYEYSFVNVDASPIWHFGVCTTFVTNGGTGGTKFNGHPTWGGPDWVDIDSAGVHYDSRNLDPNIIGHTNTWTNPWEDPNTAIQLDEAAVGYSFTASVYDNSPKYYWYETIASGYAPTNGTGKVAAVGLTLPEPTTMVLLGLGGLVIMKCKTDASFKTSKNHSKDRNF